MALVQRLFGSKPKEQTPVAGRPRVLSAEQRKHWDDKGFLILPGIAAGAPLVQLEAEVDRYWAQSRTGKSELVVDLLGSHQGRRYLHDAPLDARAEPHKLNDLYLVSDAVRDIVLGGQLTGVLTDLLGGAPLVCNSLTFEFGSQQPFHTDSLYMTPPKGLNLAATWLALEDCTADAGPLRFYPGSHLIPPYRFSHGRMTSIPAEMDRYELYMAAEVARRGLIEERFCAKRGDIFIWHSQLYHGGSPIRNPRKSRRSLVTHYFLAEDLPGADRVEHVPGGFWMRRPHQPVH